MPAILRKVLFALALTYPVVPAFANVITDWDAKAVAFVAPVAAGAPGQRELAMVHVAMFDAVNLIERRYPIDQAESRGACHVQGLAGGDEFERNMPR